MDKLVKYIKAHNMEAWADGGKLFAVAVSVWDGMVIEEVQEIEPNIKSVREWLGY